MGNGDGIASVGLGVRSRSNFNIDVSRPGGYDEPFQYGIASRWPMGRFLFSVCPSVPPCQPASGWLTLLFRQAMEMEGRGWMGRQRPATGT